MKKITHPQGTAIVFGSNQFVNWLRINKIDCDSQSQQMRLYRSIWNSAYEHSKKQAKQEKAKEIKKDIDYLLFISNKEDTYELCKNKYDEIWKKHLEGE